MTNNDKELIKICMMVRNEGKFKIFKLMYFSYKLIDEKKIRQMDILKNYLMVYHKSSNDTLQTALKILKKYNLITITKNLSDCRKYTIFPNNV